MSKQHKIPFPSLEKTSWRAADGEDEGHDTVHMGREEGSSDKKSSNGGKCFFWKVFMSTFIP